MEQVLDYLRPFLKVILGWDIRATSLGVSGGIALHGALSLAKDPVISILGITLDLSRFQIFHAVALGIFLATLISLFYQRRISSELLDRIKAIRTLRSQRAITRVQANGLYLDLAKYYVERNWQSPQLHSPAPVQEENADSKRP